MARRFRRKSSRKTKVRLSPKNADEILRQEFTDKKGNKIINIIRFKPQNPFKPDFKQTFTTKYKPNEEE